MLDDWVGESNAVRAVDVFVERWNPRLGSMASTRQRLAGPRIILRRCSSFTSTAISTESIEPAAGA